MSKLYICDHTRFKSYLAESIVSFVEYKVNVGGCTTESFLPIMSLFDRHCMNHPEPETCLKQDTVLSFLAIGPDEKNSTAIRKSSIIRSFGRYLAAVLRNKDVYIVPTLVKRGQKTFVPYVFTHDEIARLLRETRNYQPKQEYTKTPNMFNCMPCIFTMLYCTGMRISEVTGLKTREVDLEQRIIHINQAKNDNHRIVTISDSLAEACYKYLEKTKNCKTSDIYFFDTGSAYNDGRVSFKRAYTYFRRFLDATGIEHKGKGFGPRMRFKIVFCTCPKAINKIIESTDAGKITWFKTANNSIVGNTFHFINPFSDTDVRFGHEIEKIRTKHGSRIARFRSHGGIAILK